MGRIAVGARGGRARRSYPRRLLALGVWIVVVACAPKNEQPSIAKAIDEAVAAAGDGGRIDLAAVVPGEWDTVYGFPGYTSDAEVTAATGIDFGMSDDTRVPADGLNLAVFVTGDTLVAWCVLNQGDNQVAVRFDEDLYRQPTQRDQAVLRVTHTDTTVSGHPLFRLSVPD